MRFLIVTTALLYASFISAQTDTSKLELAYDTLLPVIVTAEKLDLNPDELPYARTEVFVRPLRAAQAQISLKENLALVPGLYSQNATNYAQDLRISIRGFGARSAFGIRGIKLIVDGIPETTPDGQGQIDNLPLGLISSINITHGPAATLYGNASGGVISIETENNFVPATEFGLTVGSFESASARSGLRKYQFKTQQQIKSTRIAALFDHSRSAGYRSHSRQESSLLNLRVDHSFSAQSSLQFQANYTDSPMAQDPGGLTLEDAMENRSAARQRNIDFAAGEAIQHWKLGLRYQQEGLNNIDFKSYAFLSGRQFEGRLPFEFGGWINLDRTYYGQGSSLGFKLQEERLKISLGYAFASQSDDRQRFRNLMGEQGGETLNQIEGFSSLGIYALATWQLENWLIFGGIRQDFNWIKLEDRRNTLESEQQLNALNPSLGFNFKLSEANHLFGNYRAGFETPSLTELANNPSGAPGFNPNLGPQRSHNFELGWRHHSMENIFKSYRITAFHISVADELVPFELDQFAGRTFYRNAGKSLRTGLEIETRLEFSAPWSLLLAYTWLHARYRDFELEGDQLRGNALPGLPEHWASAQMTFQPNSPFLFSLQTHYTGSINADDRNMEEVVAFVIVDLNASYKLQIGPVGKNRHLLFFAGVNNLLSADYFDNIRINAFGGRYYETGPQRNIYGGLRLVF